MKILITGATGFVGSHLCEKLNKEGHEIFALVRNQEKFNNLKIAALPIEGTLSRGSITSWISKLPNDLDTVIHCAGLVHSFKTKSFYDVNFNGTESLIKELILKYQQLHFMLISSLSVAGPSESFRAKTEEDGPRPYSNYGHSKLLGEISVKDLAPEKWTTTIVRPPIIIGPRDDAFLDIFKMVKSGIVLYPGITGRTKRYSFISVFDLIEGINKLLINENKTKNKKLFYLSHPKIVRYGTIINEIKKLLNKDKLIQLPIPIFFLHILALIISGINMVLPNFRPRLTSDKVKDLIPSNWTCNSMKSQEELGISYKWSLNEILKATYEFYLEQKKI